MTASLDLPPAGMPGLPGFRPPPPQTPLSRKLCRYAGLPYREAALLEGMISGRIRFTRSRADVAVEGGPTDKVHFVLQGWGCRYKMLEDGRRQILALLLPGDVCCLDAYVPATSDQSLATLSRMTYAEVPRSEVLSVARSNPALADAFGWHEAVSRSIGRQWTVNLGQRSAGERLAHLICEMHHRLDMVGLVEGTGFATPLSQIDLADVLGLSNVHVNRTVRDMRRAGLIDLKARRMAIRDHAALMRLASFDPAYLEPPRVIGPGRGGTDAMPSFEA